MISPTTIYALCAIELTDAEREQIGIMAINLQSTSGRDSEIEEKVRNLFFERVGRLPEDEMEEIKVFWGVHDYWARLVADERKWMTKKSQRKIEWLESEVVRLNNLLAPETPKDFNT